jgi:PqqD family protein of HPr-rel-A system
VFNPMTGSTHLLNEASSRIVHLLGNEASTIGAICDELDDGENRKDFLAKVEAHLKQLEQLGLIEQIP